MPRSVQTQRDQWPDDEDDDTKSPHPGRDERVVVDEYDPEWGARIRVRRPGSYW